MTSPLCATLLGVAFASAVTGCAPTVLTQTVPGSSVPFNGSDVSTQAALSASGTVQSVSVTLPYAALASAPMSQDINAAHGMVAVPFPQAVKDQTFFDHFEMAWMPMGHEPARFSTPHFDFHFYGVAAAAVAAVDCKSAVQPALTAVPPGWAPPVPPGLPDPTVMCIPHMGYHAVPLTEFSAPGQFQAGVFDKVMITGFYGGQFTFIEPMVTQATLDRKADFTLPVPHSPALNRPTLFPSTFRATYDAAADTYTLTFSDFRSQ